MTAPAMPKLLREIVAYCREAGHDWSNLAEAEKLLASPQAQQAAVSDADLYGTLEPTIVSRYIVEKRVGGGFWGYCVKAGDGAQEIFVGHKNACEHVRQALQTACLDGAYMAHEKARAILALRPAQQATPEPVGEPVARVELMQTGGSAGLATRIMEIDDPLRERLRPGDLLYTHPAPGVPEGWTDADADAARLAMELECLLLDTKDTAAVSHWWKSANEALDLHRARLAAAQAKGGEHA